MNIPLGRGGIADPSREAASSAIHTWQAHVRYFVTTSGRMWCQAKLSQEGQERRRQGLPTGVAEACRASSPVWPQGMRTCRRFSRAMRVARSRTPAKVYSCETLLLERLAQDLQDMAVALWPCIQEAHAMVGQRHVTRHRHLAPADQPRIREGMVGRVTRAGHDQPHAVAGEAGVAVDTRGLKGFSQGHRRQDGGEPPCEPHGEGPTRSGLVRVHLPVDALIRWPTGRLHSGGTAPLRRLSLLSEMLFKPPLDVTQNLCDQLHL
jgi:hypothetical protein